MSNTIHLLPKGSTLHKILNKTNAKTNLTIDVSTDNEEPEIFYYTKDDLGDQDHNRSKNDIVTGDFKVPIKDKKDKIVGYLAWHTSGIYGSVNNGWLLNDEDCCIELTTEAITLNIGTTNDAKSWHGTALTVTSNGYYDLDIPYTFLINNGLNEKASLTITNIGKDKREVIKASSKKYNENNTPTLTNPGMGKK